MLTSVGLFGVARSVFRSVSPEVARVRKRELAFYNRFISPGDLVFDIGTNLGQKSEIFLENGATVISLEPNPHCVAYLEKTIGKTAQCEIVPKAVGAKPGEAKLSFRGTSATSSLRGDWHALKYGAGELETSRVEVTTLDHLIAEFGVPSFCKIDVEGFEKEVFSGLSQPLPMIEFEYHSVEKDNALACLEMREKLGPAEFNFAVVDESALLHEQWLDPKAFRAMLNAPDAPTVGDIFIRAISSATKPA